MELLQCARLRSKCFSHMIHFIFTNDLYIYSSLSLVECSKVELTLDSICLVNKGGALPSNPASLRGSALMPLMGAVVRAAVTHL